MKKRIVEIAVKVIVAALTAFLTAITTTSCLGHGPITLWIIGARSIRLWASIFAELLADMIKFWKIVAFCLVVSEIISIFAHG